MRWEHGLHLLDHLMLDAHLLEDRLDHEIRLTKVTLPRGSAIGEARDSRERRVVGELRQPTFHGTVHLKSTRSGDIIGVRFGAVHGGGGAKQRECALRFSPSKCADCFRGG